MCLNQFPPVVQDTCVFLNLQEKKLRRIYPYRRANYKLNTNNKVHSCSRSMNIPSVIRNNMWYGIVLFTTDRNLRIRVLRIVDCYRKLNAPKSVKLELSTRGLRLYIGTIVKDKPFIDSKSVPWNYRREIEIRWTSTIAYAEPVLNPILTYIHMKYINQANILLSHIWICFWNLATLGLLVGWLIYGTLGH